MQSSSSSKYWNTYKERKRLNDISSSALYYIERQDNNDSSSSSSSNISEFFDFVDDDYDHYNMSYLYDDDLWLENDLLSLDDSFSFSSDA